MFKKVIHSYDLRQLNRTGLKCVAIVANSGGEWQSNYENNSDCKNILNLSIINSDEASTTQ